MQKSAPVIENRLCYGRPRCSCLPSLLSLLIFAVASLPVRAQELPQGSAMPVSPQNPTSVVTERAVSIRTLPRNFLQDQKDIWLFPVHEAKGQHWLPVLAVTGVTGAFIAA